MPLVNIQGVLRFYCRYCSSKVEFDRGVDEQQAWGMLRKEGWQRFRDLQGIVQHRCPHCQKEAA